MNLKLDLSCGRVSGNGTQADGSGCGDSPQSPPASPGKSVYSLAEEQAQAKLRYETIILRLCAAPVHELLEAVRVLSEHFDVFPDKPPTGGEDSGGNYVILRGSLDDVQLSYAKALNLFAKVTNRLRIPYSPVLSRLHKRDTTVSSMC